LIIYYRIFLIFIADRHSAGGPAESGARQKSSKKKAKREINDLGRRQQMNAPETEPSGAKNGQ